MLAFPRHQIVRPDLLKRGVVDEVLAIVAVDIAGRALDRERVVFAVALASVGDVRALQAEVGGLRESLYRTGGCLVRASTDRVGGGIRMQGADDARVAFGRAVVGGI